MIKVRQSKKSEITSTFYSKTDDISELFDDKKLSEKVNYALSSLKEQPKKAFKTLS